MTKSNITASLLLTAMLAAGAAQAQTGSASSTSDIPVKAGEASTTTQGAPNAKPSNATGGASTMGTTSGSSDSMGAKPAKRTAAATSGVPTTSGEASTTVNGRPNAMPNDPMVTKGKEERRAEKDMKKSERRAARETAVMGQKGAQAGAPAGTPAVSPAGTPRVQDGGTPK